jgi:two-component system sensor histidine kinase CiaH
MFTRARLRLTAWYAGALAAVLVALGGSAYFILRHELDSEIDGSLDRALAQVQAPPPTDDHHASDPRRGSAPDEGAEPSFPDRAAGVSTDIFTLWLSANGSVVGNPRGVPTDRLPLAELANAARGGQYHEDADSAGARVRLLAAPASSGVGAEATVVVVGRSLAARDRQLDVLAIVLGSGGAAGLVLAAGGGFWLAGRALRPISLAMDTQRRFVSDASHELRTPIAVVATNAEVLLRHPDDSVESSIDQVAAISDEARHMSRLVDDLLTLARADEHRLEVRREPVALDGLLQGLARDMAALAEDRNVCLRAETAPAHADGDPQRLRQVAAILVDNALKYTPRGGTVVVRTWREGAKACFSVTDTGPGIAAQDQPHIFDRFYRVDRARTAGGGTGLGLAIAKSIVEAHEGRISVQSSPGQGAVFTVRLPARPEK